MWLGLGPCLQASPLRGSMSQSREPIKRDVSAPSALWPPLIARSRSSSLRAPPDRAASTLAAALAGPLAALVQETRVSQSRNDGRCGSAPEARFARAQCRTEGALHE